jgi:hypothetical protein
MSDIVERSRRRVAEEAVKYKGCEAEYPNDMWLLIKMADEVERLRAALKERLAAERVYRQGRMSVADLILERERLRAFAQYVVDMDPDNQAPLFEKARRALEEKT